MAASGTHLHRDYTIGWVCALRKEQTAATAMLDTIHDDLPNAPSDPNAYTLGSIGKHNIVIACLPEGRYGNNAATTTVTWMVSTFPSVRFGLMVGIGGGIPSNGVRLGDVVVSKPDSCFPGVIQWDRGKIEQGGTIEHTGSLNNPPTALLTSLAKLGTKRELEGSKIPIYLAAMGEKWPNLATKYTQLESLRDVLFADDCLHVEGPPIEDSAKGAHIDDTETEADEEEDTRDCRFCDITQARKRKLRATRIHYGLIASGNMVVKDAQFRNWLNENDARFLTNCQVGVSGIRSDLGLAVECLVEARAHRHDQNDEKTLEWLSSLDYGAEHSDILKRWQPGTGQWFLNSTQFREFIETNKQMIFCSGIPGSGKTVMAAAVIDHLHKQFNKDSRVGIAYFYFNFKKSNEHTPEAVFLSLLKQLVQQQSYLSENVKFLYETHAKNKTRPSLMEILKAFQEALEAYLTVFIVIDALDECATLDDCREIILSKMFACAAASNLKLFTTSRHIPEISDRFQSALHLEIGATESDIRRYIDSRLAKLPRTSFISQNTSLQEEIKIRINAVVSKMYVFHKITCYEVSSNSLGRFLLAQLHFDRLTECITPKAVMKALKSLPTGSDAYDYAYSAAMDRINQQVSGRSELAIKALSWITHARRPLSVFELQHALGVEVGEDKFDEENVPQVEDIVSTAVGLVTIDEKSKIIRLVHYTAQEFFERTKEKWLPDAETYIADICSTYLSYSAFENPCEPYGYKFRGRMKSYKLYTYAVLNWRHHVTASKFSRNHVNFLKKTSSFYAYLQDYQSHVATRLPWSFRDFKYSTSLHFAAALGWNKIVTHLLRDFADADVRDDYNCTPFYMAASGGHSLVMETLLSFGQVDINVISSCSRFTPLISAAQGGHCEAVKLLLDTGKVNAGFECINKKTALWYAAVGGHDTVVQLLLDSRNYDADVIREIHSSALLGAVIMEKETTADLILNAGNADINVQTTSLYSPFFWGPCYNDKRSNDTTWVYPKSRMMGWFEDILNPDPAIDSLNQFKTPSHIATDGRFDMNDRDESLRTLLMRAVSAGRKDAVRFLLNKRALGIDHGDQSDRTSLHHTTASDRREIVEFLINAENANIDITNEAGDTPLCIATKHGHNYMVRLLLKAQGVDTNIKDKHGRDLLSLAVEWGNVDTAKFFLDTGKFDVNTRDHYSLTPLMLRTKNGKGPEIIQLLLNTGNVDINATDFEYGRTALLWAAYNGYLESFTALLQTGGFDINKRDVCGFTAFTIATNRQNTRIVEFLLNLDKVDLYTRDYKHKRTALMWAAHTGCSEVVALLLNSGKFDIGDVDTNGLDAIEIAAKRGNRETIKLLKDERDARIKQPVDLCGTKY
ncbi:Ankyrin repeat domain-containing protein 50 [Trichoderma lentiforme]|uniref:Ankyrin repeat domain-containing protein 50 n=1 Tax=Trichoderma lentiforme TaxID=1567552 RepID=A0A9P5CCG3_9HYPO|nr:Ankyrin repeat domain-containing protein 50 [Trichoderma lentiforme]